MMSHTEAGSGRVMRQRLASYPALAVALATCLAVQLAWPLAVLPLHVSWDYGEGWNAYWAARAMAGAPLYTSEASPITDNYPPLSFYLFGLAGRLAGDQIIGGRLLSLAALAACTAMTGMLAARLGAGRRWGVATGGAFLLYAATFTWRYVGTHDPQWLAASFTVAALLLLSGPRGPSVGRLVGAAALLVTGGLVKHNQLAAPIAVTIWLARGDRRLLAIWLAGGILFAGGALITLRAAFGPQLLEQVIHHHRLLKAQYAVDALETLSGLLPEMALAAVLWARTRHDEGGVMLLLLFASTALVLGMVERLGTGVSVNAHFDAALGLVAAAGVALGRGHVLTEPSRRRMAAIAFAPLALATLALVPGTVRRVVALRGSEARWQEAVAMIRSAQGPVACELPALCYWAGRPFLVDFYNYGQKLRTIGDPAHLYGAITRRSFAAVVVVRDRRFRAGDGRLPDAYNRAIAASYHPVLALPRDALMLLPDNPH